MNFLDLFAGIGGFRLGMEMAGHTPVGYVEWDKFARKSYEAMHNTEGEWTAHDITAVTDDDIRQLGNRGQIDVICGGFPCQAFSVAGKRKGFDDTRGTLFFDIMRFANIIRPRYLFLENVRGLLNHDNGNTFETILRTLDDIGYDAEWQVLNSFHYSTRERPVPHNRERVFIVGHLRGQSTRQVFPIQRTSRAVIGGKGGILAADYRYDEGLRIRKNGISPCLMANNSKMMDDGLSGKPYAVLTPERLYKQQNGRRFKNAEEPMFTLTSQDRHGVMLGVDMRKLTPKECFRLQGFPDELFDKAAEVNSDSQLYKQAGNSVTVNVIYEIARKMR